VVAAVALAVTEAVTNVVKHAHEPGTTGRGIQLTGSVADDLIEITVSDQGRGFRELASPGLGVAGHRMKLHANARTCPKSRRLLVDRLERDWSLTVAKWLSRWRVEGEEGLLDCSSAPRRRPAQLATDRVKAIEALGMALSTCECLSRARAQAPLHPAYARATARTWFRHHCAYGIEKGGHRNGDLPRMRYCTVARISRRTFRWPNSRNPPVRR